MYNVILMWLTRILKASILFLIISIFVTGTQPATKTVQIAQLPLAIHSMSLNDRYGNSFVNNVFKDNILLTLAYMSGNIQNKSQINWTAVEKPVRYDYVLRPGEVFAFHDDILASYKNKPLLTTKAHFSSDEGFLSDGYLVGDGVCHLASLINWTAIDAGLSTNAPTSHNFAVIPDIPAKYGVAIYSSPTQNLYIENTFNVPVVFKFNYENGVLNLAITKQLPEKFVIQNHTARKTAT